MNLLAENFRVNFKLGFQDFDRYSICFLVVFNLDIACCHRTVRKWTGLHTCVGDKLRFVGRQFYARIRQRPGVVSFPAEYIILILPADWTPWQLEIH